MRILFDCRGMPSRTNLCCSERESQTFVSMADKSGAGAKCNLKSVLVHLIRHVGCTNSHSE